MTTSWAIAEEGKDPPKYSRERRKYFAIAEMKCHGYRKDIFWVDAGALLYLGLLLSHIKCVPMAKCDFHGDAHINPRETNGANVNVCPNHLVNMNYPNKSRSVTGRRSLN